MQENDILNEIRRLLSPEKVEILPPASKEQVKKAEDLLNVCLPEELLKLLNI